MLQQGPELTQDAPASADSESAEPEKNAGEARNTK